MAASCDAVSDDGFGVQLGRFNPVELAAQRPSDPVFAGPRDPREPPAVRALLDALTAPAGPVQVTGDIAWRRRPALYREHALFVTVSPDQAREQLACGARVIMATGEQSSMREQIAAAAAERALTAAEAFGRLREIFTEYATPVRLAGLASLSGLPGHLVTGRQIAVLARVPDAAGAAALADGLRKQRIAPAELIVAVAARPGESAEVSGHAVTAALGELAGLGTAITAIPAPPPARRRRLALARGQDSALAVGGAVAGGPPIRSVLPDRPGVRAGVRAGRRGRLRRVQLRVRDLARPGTGPAGVLQPGRRRPRPTALLCQLRSCPR